MSEEHARLKRDINFGWNVEDFLKTDIGEFLVGRQAEERAEALEALAIADPEDAKKIRALQTQIAVLDKWQSWMEEAVNIGRQAQAELAEKMG